ncbi:MAG: hypothetical protein ACWGMZ_09890, partial [Thermoguttaceae bacterium]
NYQAAAMNPLSLVNIRDAAIASRFTSRKALCAWLNRAFGQNWVLLDNARRHIRQSLALCPLQGRAYVYLAKLSFLDQAPAPSVTAYLNQALLVRPFDGAVAYAAAAEAFLAGDLTRWFELAQHVFHCGRRYQRQLIVELISHTPSQQVPQMVDLLINRFPLDLEDLQILHTACAKRCPAEQLTNLCRYRVQKIEAQAAGRHDADAAGLWLQARYLHILLKESSRSLDCMKNALNCNPNNYDLHKLLAADLLANREYREAESQLRWCLQRKPADMSLKNKLKEALKGRLGARHEAALEKGRNF